ncbi:MAG TPA: glycosyltransferase family 4 protein [Plantibacter sp.]|uniref:glycosyltransferase family 4 protein n=1 Tax=unclassified Plantibacter TaxID=2624265 RepID=UPI002B9ECA72|nr:glycosyltransferase family 4 protein [Plantibacter sp.]
MSARAVASQRWLVATTEYAGVTAYTGGIGRHYASLLPALVRLGVDVDVVVLSESPLNPDARLDGVRLVASEQVPSGTGIAAFRRRAKRVAEAYARAAYDRVFLPEWNALGTELPRKAPLLTNLATSMRLSNEVSGFRLRDFPPQRRASIVLQNRLETRQIERSAGLVPISEAMLEWTATNFRRIPRAVVVRNCIDVDVIRDAAERSDLPAGWPTGDAPVVLFLGRLERRKGVEDAMRAFGQLSARFPTTRLVLAGSSGDARFEPDRAELLSWVPPSARERVVWLGHVAGDELYRGIRASTVAMCPSRWEGFGNVALEVKATGTPLVVTHGSGYDDFCTDGLDCLMVPPAAPDRLAEALQRVLEDIGAAATRARRALEQIGRFAPDPVAASLVAAADTLLAPPGHWPAH